MQSEMGIGKWIQLSDGEQKIYLKKVDQEKILELRRKTYSECLSETNNLMSARDWLPMNLQERPLPFGLGLLFPENK
jgi:hypothetical protein